MEKEQDWHAMASEEVLRILQTSEHGLSDTEAGARLQEYGKNVLPTSNGRTWRTMLFAQVKSPLVFLLAAAAAVSFALHDWVDAGVIFAAVLLNTGLGFFQEYKATRALEALRSYVHPFARVRRTGEERTISADLLVPGDILLLSTGDRVSADARLLSVVATETEEAALTGESASVAKRVEGVVKGALLAERFSIVYAGTAIAAGSAEAVVVATGNATELGTIAALVQTTKEESTPLQKELARLAQLISLIVLILVFGLFLLGLFAGKDPFIMFETSVAVAVAAIPEGLALSVTVVLTIGMRRILKRKGLVRRLVAAETLGSVSVVCTDKTGTLTEGRMRVSAYALSDGEIRLETLEKGKTARELIEILELAALCNDGSVDVSDTLRAPVVIGSPTDRAFLEAAMTVGIQPSDLAVTHPRIAEIPFTSDRKYMATVHAWGKGEMIVAKGAPDRLLPFLTKESKKAVEAALEDMTSKGLRVLAVAHKRTAHHHSILTPEDLSDLELVGLVGLLDPLRPEAALQVAAARKAGITTIMATGDHPRTAFAIAREAGIANEGESVLTGTDLDAMDDVELAKRVATSHVFARVEPRHKIRLVRAWQSLGASVAMTGDGVNDAPALKAADIGVALGSGTEVAKEVADLVLLDDHLSTMTAAIEEGRVLFDNLRRSVVYLLSSGFTEVVLITGALLLGLPLPLLAVQILWINLVADSLPNAALALEPAEPDLLSVPPRPRGEPIFNKEIARLLLGIGLFSDGILFLVYLWILGWKDVASAQSFMFAAVGVASMVYIFSIRSFRRSLFRTPFFSNPFLLLAVGAGFFLLFLPFLISPLGTLLGLVPISLLDLALLFMIGLVKLGVMEGAKLAFFIRRSS